MGELVCVDFSRKPADCSFLLDIISTYIADVNYVILIDYVHAMKVYKAQSTDKAQIVRTLIKQKNYNSSLVKLKCMNV